MPYYPPAATSSIGSKLLYISAAEASIPSNTTETTLKSYTLPGNTLGTTRALRISAKVWIDKSSGTETTTFRFKLGTTLSVAVELQGDTGSNGRIGYLTCIIMNDGATNAQKAHAYGHKNANSAGFNVSMDNEEDTGTEDTTSDKTLSLTSQNSDGTGVTGNVSLFMVELIRQD